MHSSTWAMGASSRAVSRRSASATCCAAGSAGWQQANSSTRAGAPCGGGAIRAEIGGLVVLGPGLVAAGHAQRVERLVQGHAVQPAGRVLRHAPGRPGRQCAQAGHLQRVVGQRQVAQAQAAPQARHDAAPRGLQHLAQGRGGVAHSASTRRSSIQAARQVRAGRGQGLGFGVAGGAQAEEAADDVVRLGVGAVGGEHAVAVAAQAAAAVVGQLLAGHEQAAGGQVGGPVAVALHDGGHLVAPRGWGATGLSAARPETNGSPPP